MQDQRLKAVLIDLIHPRMLSQQSAERVVELESLVNTYGGIVVVKQHQKRFSPHPRTFIGPGKVTSLGEEGKALGANLLIVNDVLKPRQAYLIGEILTPFGMQVWDRADLILKIFAKHAKTTEARLEIELASIRHMGPRIFGMGLELSRQGGGIGTSGVGETNTEIMKRHLKERERKIREKLEDCKRVRASNRAGRKRQALKTVAIVGYTNAGKTTLLNALTGRKEYAANELFATLDTRVGSLYLPRAARTALISDTIGFIKELPEELLNAFSSTLSEVVDADFLLHVVDASDPLAMSHVAVVDDVLTHLGIHERPRLLVLNKIDQAGKEAVRKLSSHLAGRVCVAVSAEKGTGLEELVRAIEDRFYPVDSANRDIMASNTEA